MSLMKSILAVAAITAAAACQGTSTAAPRPESRAGVVAVVNGVAITEADLAVAMTAAARAGDPHRGDTAAAPPVRADVLDHLIDQELAAQRATERGLDRDPALAAELATRQAELDALRRQRLADALTRAARGDADVAIPEAELRRYYAEHLDRIQTVTHVAQILVRDRATIESARRDLDAGAAFDAVAARQFPTIPPGTRPWDLGELTWNQLPAQWAGIVDTLAVGATSPIIAGPRSRLWIVHVIDRRIDRSVTFETARPAIEAMMRADAETVAETELARSLRDGATIVRSPDEAGPGHAP